MVFFVVVVFYELFVRLVLLVSVTCGGCLMTSQACE